MSLGDESIISPVGLIRTTAVEQGYSREVKMSITHTIKVL